MRDQGIVLVSVGNRKTDPFIADHESIRQYWGTTSPAGELCIDGDGTTYFDEADDIINDIIETPWANSNTDWTCPACGKINQHNQRACGAGEWDGCGGARE